jgi:hypothetical protein
MHQNPRSTYPMETTRDFAISTLANLYLISRRLGSDEHHEGLRLPADGPTSTTDSSIWRSGMLQ